MRKDRESQQVAAWHERQMLRAKHAQKRSSATSTTSALTPWRKSPRKRNWNRYHGTTTIPSTSSSLPWYTPTTFTTLSSVQHIYPFPATQKEVASAGLFEHLLAEEKMWCMNGLRFGGAFAVYPGDPLRYHSHYTAQLVLPEEDIALTTLVANGRLGTAVKKTHLLCHVERFNPELHFSAKEGKGKRQQH